MIETATHGRSVPSKRLTLIDVFTMIRSERAYQAHLIETGRMPNPSRSIGEFITIFNHYTRRIEDSWAEGNDCVVDIKKLTAVGVACLEQHGSHEATNPLRGVLHESRNKGVRERPQVDFVEFLSQLVEAYRSNDDAVRGMMTALGDYMDDFRSVSSTGEAVLKQNR